MDKRILKASTLLSPVPLVMVSSGDKDSSNIITIAWTGTVNSEPPMLFVSIRKQRYSHDFIKERGSFVVNLVSQDLVKKADWCGVKSGREFDKFKECQFTRVYSNETNTPMIKESPVNIECKLKDIIPLGSHDMFLAEVLNVYADEKLFDTSGKMDLSKGNLVAYTHGEYYSLDKALGFFGYSVASDQVLERRLGK